MRVRLLTAIGIAAAVCSAVPSSAAESKPVVLDGAKVKEITLVGQGSAQFHDADLVALDGPERVDCKAPRCAFVDFVYKPAAGVKGDVAAVVEWTAPASDIDLYIAKVGKNGNTDIVHCGGSAGTRERVFAEAKSFKAGETYRLIIDFYRAAAETATAKLKMPGANEIKGTVPDEGFGLSQSVNCTL